VIEDPLGVRENPADLKLHLAYLRDRQQAVCVALHVINVGAQRERRCASKLCGAARLKVGVWGIGIVSRDSTGIRIKAVHFSRWREKKRHK
jgi:hypothetical protein